MEDHGATLEDRAGNTLLTFVARAHGKLDILVHSLANGPEVPKPLHATSFFINGKEQRNAVCETL